MPDRRKLTREAVARLRMPEGEGELTVWDTELRGFGVRMRAGGSKNYICKFRVGGRARQIGLGPATAEGLADARKAAAKAIHDAKAGHDPQQARVQRHQDARETFGALVDSYLDHLDRRVRAGTLKAGSAAETRRYLETTFAALAGRSARAVSTGDIARALDDATAKSGPVASNRARASVSAMFAWALKRGRAEQNPVTGTDANAERTRERVLAPDELRAVWHAAGDEGEFGRMVRLLVLTGCRRQEVGDMKWSELSPDRSTWTIPGARTKNGEALTVTMPPSAQAVLADQPVRDQRDYVFGEGKIGFQGWTRAKWRLDDKIKLILPDMAGWTLHDLRRSFATICAERLGVAPHVVEACLNHVSTRRVGVAGIYNRATYAEPMAQAWAVYSQWVEDLVIGEKGDPKVIALRR